jgi:hypothetical protein
LPNQFRRNVFGVNAVLSEGVIAYQPTVVRHEHVNDAGSPSNVLCGLLLDIAGELFGFTGKSRPELLVVCSERLDRLKLGIRDCLPPKYLRVPCGGVPQSCIGRWGIQKGFNECDLVAPCQIRQLTFAQNAVSGLHSAIDHKLGHLSSLNRSRSLPERFGLAGNPSF